MHLKWRWRGWVALVLMLALGPAGTSARAQSNPSFEDESSTRLSAAAAIQGATRARLGVLGDAFTCPDARFVSFRHSDADPQVVYQWYIASQLWADADLLRVASLRTTAGESPIVGWDTEDTRCYLDKGFVFLDRLWDDTSAGYFPGADPLGGNVNRSARFTDDNLVAGLGLVDAARTTSDPYAQQRYIHAARREADFLLLESTGLWDSTFGGGFWWNTGHGDTLEGKPAQTNALAALFFARLYAVTHEPSYRDWALRSLLWLDTILYDPGRHLYRWSVSYQDLAHRTGAVINPRYFNYDQGIAIEAQVAALGLDGDQNRLTRARAVAANTQEAFWARNLGGYNLEAGVDQVYASYGAWTSLGALALFDTDHDPAWLEHARSNLQALEAGLREADNGFAYRAYRCVDRIAKGCEAEQVSRVVDHTRDTAAQAWVQHLQTALAERLLPPAQCPTPTPATDPSGDC